MEIPEEKYNSVFYFNMAQEVKVVDRPYGNYWNPGQLDAKENFQAIGVVFINGPITSSGGASSYGMEYVSSTMMKMYADDRIKGFLVVGNSGGGASSAVDIMTDTINEIKQTKPVWGLVKKGGTAASAMYGIIAACSKIYAESEMSMVGSTGTMIQIDGRKANSESPDGVKHIRVYASKSTKKNEQFEAALNDDNYDLIRTELLDPINERFLQGILSNRPVLQGTDFENGNAKFAKDSVGTYIDGIKSFKEVVSEMSAEIEAAANPKSKSKNNFNKPKISNQMTVDELKQQFPETHQSIFQAGVNSEKDRVGTWMAHSKTDPEMVAKGIESGLSITGAQREVLIVKAASSAKVTALQQDSPPAGTTPPSAEEGEEELTEEEKEASAFYANILK
jgi:ClpP class serine protease